MDHLQGIESTLNALLLNAKDLQETFDDLKAHREHAHLQQQILDLLFHLWNPLPEKQKRKLIKSKFTQSFF